MAFVLYVADTETTGLDIGTHEVIELSLYRLSDQQQKTWCIKPSKYDVISPDALRVNGHQLQDLMHKTATGKEIYRLPEVVIPEVENWMMEDFATPDERILVGQNVLFDKGHLEYLWKSCGLNQSFPFGKKYLDTIQIELLLDFAGDKQEEFYNLSALCKKYGVKNEKAHSAAADCAATVKIFNEQVARLKTFGKNV